MELLCPVCRQKLERMERCLKCPDGHSFDMARQGYINLLTVDRKHAKHPGDTKEQVAARKAFLDGGFYAPIAQTLCDLTVPLSPEAVLDAGCGEGYYLTNLQKQLPEADFAGVDISKDAVRFASVRNKQALWLTATATHLPFPDESFDLILSMFALTAEEEFARILRPGGHYLQVIAGAEHLMGLKSIIYPELLLRDKNLHPTLKGFALETSQTLEFSIALNSAEQVQNLLSMTPHFWRITKDGANRLATTETLTDTAQVIFNLYRKEEAHAG